MNRKKCRIAIIASYAPSLLNFRGHLLKAMIASGHEVIAYAPDATPVISEQLRNIGVQYESIPMLRGGTNPLKDIRTIITLYHVFCRCDPDITLAYTIKPVIYGSIAAKLAGVPRSFSIITGLGSVFMEPENKERWFGFHPLRSILRWMYHVALHTNSIVFFQNPDDRAFFIQHHLINKESTMLINGSGVDLERFALRPPITQEYPSFLMIARLLKDKGIVEYATAAKVLRGKYPKVVFRLLGWLDPHNPTSIPVSQLQSWEQDGAIEYLGVADDVRPFITACDVYVLPSYREGTPRTVLEAMAMGRPIVTTNTAGCRETVIPEENGFLIPPRNVDALVDALERFILQPDLIAKMGARSREIAVAKYDVHDVNRAIMSAMEL